MKNLALWAVSALFVAACTPKAEQPTDSGLLRTNFQTEVGGKKTDLYTLRNKNNMEVCVTNFGGRIVSVMVPDKDGKMQDVVLGFDSIQDYISKPSDFGASIGRYANRINQGRFTLDSIEYQLPQNNYGHCLHGGPNGFQYRVFDAVQPNPQEVELTYVAADGEEGFPGNITCKVLMKLTDDNAIDIRYEAETDKPTIVNMTNHSYFNLDGEDSESVEGQHLQIFADSFAENDAGCLPTGRIVSLDSEEGSPFDFREPTEIGKRLHEENIHLKNGSGYDHNYLLKKQPDGLCARAYSRSSGILLECRTSEPGMQLYTGNFLSTSNIVGKGGKSYADRAGFCLETQHYPNAMEHPEFPSVVLPAGELYDTTTEYHISLL